MPGSVLPARDEGGACSGACCCKGSPANVLGELALELVQNRRGVLRRCTCVGHLIQLKDDGLDACDYFSPRRVAGGIFMAGNAGDALLKKRVMAALAPGWIAYINFTYNGFRIATADYLRVRRAIEKDFVHLDVQTLGQNREAQYNSYTNTMSFGEYNFGFMNRQKAVIAHEATHCIIDIKKKKFLAIESEIIAFIAEQSYLTPYWQNFSPDMRSAEGVAREIVRNMWKKDPTHLRPGVPALNSYMPEIESLAQMLLNRAHYDEIRANPGMVYYTDGVKGA